MRSFLQKHASRVTGILHGFDRLVLRATLRQICYPAGLAAHLNRCDVLLTGFGDYCQQTTEKLKAAALVEPQALNRPNIYLRSSRISKEDTAREVAAKDNITSGLICLIRVSETASSFEIHKSRQSKKLEIQSLPRRSLHFYRYWIDDEMGFMSARIQTWFPFAIQICINGREWLARRLDKEGIGYERRANCFVRIDDLDRAQRFMKEQLATDWSGLVHRISRQLNPAHDEIFAASPVDYYATVHQSEWASDVMFRSEKDVADIYPQLCLGAMTAFRTPDVLRFFGRTASSEEVTTSLVKYTEGVRLRHRVGDNSVKMYDKQGQVLRVETTLNDHTPFKAYDAEAKGEWRKMRKGTSDIYRRAEISQNVNERYLEGLSALDTSRRLGDAVKQLCRAGQVGRQRVRGLRPWSEEDHALLETVARGEFMVNGLRNRDLVEALFPGEHSQEERRRLTGRVTTKIRLLRGHGIIQKVPKTHRYMVTRKGREVLNLLLQAQSLTTEDFAKLAA